MTSLALWTVLILMAQKTVREIRVSPPFEWVGELAATLISGAVAVAVALALHLALTGNLLFDPPPQPAFRSSTAVPGWLIPTA